MKKRCVVVLPDRTVALAAGTTRLAVAFSRIHRIPIIRRVWVTPTDNKSSRCFLPRIEIEMRGEQAGVEIFRRIYIIISSIPDILNSSFEREFYWTFDHERGEFPTSTVSHFPDDV